MDPLSQQLLLTLGGKKDSTYVDDVFSTYVYAGTGGGGRSITNGIDLAGEGGLVWVKEAWYGQKVGLIQLITH